MRLRSRPIFILFHLLWLLPLSGFSQLGDWDYRTPVQLDNGGQPAYTAGAYLIKFDTQTPISLGRMAADGRDIRFADSCGQNSLPYWIESDINTDSTLIWVRIPVLNSGATMDFYLYHGFSSANPGSAFNITFPNALISQGNNLTLQGLQTYDWFALEAGDTLFLVADSLLDIQASRVLINGIVMGDGAGSPPPTALSQNGMGNGPGQTSFNAGAGGAGYGNNGGTGGYDFADTPGVGGNAYGTRIGLDLHTGSSGASSSLRQGGAGGGAIRAKALDIEIGGVVYCRGAAAQQPGGTQGGGGGAGGGILFQSRYLAVQGGLVATGGAGSVGFQSGNDDGGGGAGGRIKLFWEEFIDQGNYQLTGGAGGPNGSFAPGQPGGEGTFLDTTQVYPAPVAVVGLAEVSPLPGDPLLIPDPSPICAGETSVFNLPMGYDSLSFFLNGQLAQDSTLATYVPGTLLDGDQVKVAAYFQGCILRDTLVIAVATAPVLGIVANDSSPCLGDTVILDAGIGWAEVTWNVGDSGAVLAATNSGFFIATAVNFNGCTAIDTYAVNLGIIPFPVIQTTGLPACAGEPVSLSTTQSYSGYSWSTGATGPSTVIFNSGPYTVTVTGGNGCSNAVTTNLMYDTLPFPNIVQLGDTLFAQQGYVNYQWLWNGNALNGATNYFYVPTFNGNFSVKVIGTNNCSNTSSATFVLVGIEKEVAFGWELFPNPGRARVRLRPLSGYSQELELAVFNVDGRVVSKELEVEMEGNEGWVMNTTKLPPGVYLLIIRGEGRVAYKKMVILE